MAMTIHDRPRGQPPAQSLELDLALSNAVIADALSRLRGKLSDTAAHEARDRLCAWIQTREGEYATAAVPLRTHPHFLALPKLALGLPAAFIDATSVVTLKESLRSPTAAEVGIAGWPEREPHFGGLALSSICVLSDGAPMLTLSHEIAHLVQQRLVGAPAYTLHFIATELTREYRSSPFEVSARTIEHSMAQAGISRLDLVDTVRRSLRSAFGVG